MTKGRGERKGRRESEGHGERSEGRRGGGAKAAAHGKKSWTMLAIDHSDAKTSSDARRPTHLARDVREAERGERRTIMPPSQRDQGESASRARHRASRLHMLYFSSIAPSHRWGTFIARSSWLEVPKISAAACANILSPYSKPFVVHAASARPAPARACREQRS